MKTQMMQMKILLQKHPLHQRVLLLATTTNDGTLVTMQMMQMKILLQKHPLHQRVLLLAMTTNDGTLMTTQMKTHYF
jgi:flagellar biosynthesis GTPase FlhF